MRCKDIEKLLPAYAEDGLGGEERGRVSSHLGRCPDCAGLVERLRRTGTALFSLGEVEPGPAFMARLRDIPTAAAATRRRSPVFVLRSALQPVLAGAFLVMAFTAAMVFTPAGGRLLKALDRQFHAGYSKITRVYARAESAADSLGGAGERILLSLENLPPMRGEKE